MLTLSQNEMGKLLKEAERVGAGVTDAQTKASRAFTQQQQKLGAAFDATRRNVATELMPVVGDAMRQVSDYMIENRDEIGKFAEKFADGLERALPIIGEIVQGIGKVGGALIDGAEKLKEWSGSWENVGKIIGAAVLAPMALRIGSMLISVGRLGAALVGLGPSMKEIGDGFRALKRVIVAQVGAAAAATEAAGKRMKKAFTFGGALGKALRLGGGAVALSVTPTAMADGTLKGKPAPNVTQDDIDAEAERARREQGKGETGWIGRTLQDWGIVTKPQKRAIGGSFSAGRGLIVGERGPEAMFPSQGGYIATNRAVENMAGMIESIRDGASGMAQQAAGAVSNVTIHALIDARGMDANELKIALEDLHRRASQGALFDHPADFGQYA